jgi:hypothetical protein
VYSKTAELRQRIETELREMDTEYHQVRLSLQRMDSRTNATLMETMTENQQKARLTADTLHKLLAFIDTSARQVERNEQMIARVFTTSRVRAGRTGGVG